MNIKILSHRFIAASFFKLWDRYDKLSFLLPTILTIGHLHCGLLSYWGGNRKHSACYLLQSHWQSEPFLPASSSLSSSSDSWTFPAIVAWQRGQLRLQTGEIYLRTEESFAFVDPLSGGTGILSLWLLFLAFCHKLVLLFKNHSGHSGCAIFIKSLQIVDIGKDTHQDKGQTFIEKSP